MRVAVKPRRDSAASSAILFPTEKPAFAGFFMVLRALAGNGQRMFHLEMRGGQQEWGKPSQGVGVCFQPGKAYPIRGVRLAANDNSRPFSGDMR